VRNKLLFSRIPHLYFIKVFCSNIFVIVNPNLVGASATLSYTTVLAEPSRKDRIRITLQAFYDHGNLHAKTNKNVKLKQEEKIL
jgi:hypothetical protein